MRYFGKTTADRGRTDHFSDIFPTVTDLDSVKMNQSSKYLRQM